MGVFLDDNPPNPSMTPAILDFTGTIGFTALFPVLQQTFFIGDGCTGTGAGTAQQVHIPSTATRLFLGFPDACGYNGPPSCYFDHGGAVTATFSIAGSGASVPDPASVLLVGCGLLGLAVYRRKRQTVRGRVECITRPALMQQGSRQTGEADVCPQVGA